MRCVQTLRERGDTRWRWTLQILITAARFHRPFRSSKKAERRSPRADVAEALANGEHALRNALAAFSPTGFPRKCLVFPTSVWPPIRVRDIWFFDGLTVHRSPPRQLRQPRLSSSSQPDICWLFLWILSHIALSIQGELIFLQHARLCTVALL